MSSNIVALKREELIPALVNNVGNLVKYQDAKSLFGFCVKSVMDACIWRGHNKTKDEIKVIAETLAEEISKNYRYLTIEEISRIWKQGRYGEGLSMSVCPSAFINCLDNSNVGFEQKLKRDQEEKAIAMLTQPAKREYTPEELNETRKRALLFDYNNYLKKGDFVSGITTGELEYVHNILGWSADPEEEKNLKKDAEQSAQEYYVKTQHLKYKSIKAVIRDYNLLMSEDYDKKVELCYKKEKLKLFFKNVKNGDLRHELFGNNKSV